MGAQRWRVSLELPPGARASGDSITFEPIGHATSATVESVVPSAVEHCWDVTICTGGPVGGAGGRPQFAVRSRAEPDAAPSVLALTEGQLLEPAARVPASPLRAADPHIDYLARDYESLRAMLMESVTAQVGPAFESNAVAQTVALIEELAYLGDSLSYFQDAVATESHLVTARRRVSVTRHAELLDYTVGEGRSSRTWLEVEVDCDEPFVLPAGTPVLTRVPGAAGRIGTASDVAKAVEGGATVFETMSDVMLRPPVPPVRLHPVVGGAGPSAADDHRASVVGGHFAQGATSAAIAGAPPPGLCPGAAVVLEPAATEGPSRAEVYGAQVVRIETVHLPDGATGATVVTWSQDDALGERLALAGGLQLRVGNLVLADHGRTVPPRPMVVPTEPGSGVDDLDGADGFDALGPAPTRGAGGPGADAFGGEGYIDLTTPVDDELSSWPLLPPPSAEAERERLPYWPLLPAAGIAFTSTEPPSRSTSASATLAPATLASRPAVEIVERTSSGARRWTARQSLLDSGPFAADFVVEVEDDRTAHVRFGDDRNGMRPTQGSELHVRLRVGGGSIGNVAARSLCHVASADPRVLGASNPVDARGGTDPEPLSTVRALAPDAFRANDRVVVLEDYLQVVTSVAGVVDAQVRFEPTGTGPLARVVIQPEPRWGAQPWVLEQVRAAVRDRQPLGVGLHVQPAIALPVDMVLDAWVAPGWVVSQVSRSLDVAVRDALLDPARFGFGVALRASDVVRDLMEVPGVGDVVVRGMWPTGTEPSAAQEVVPGFGRIIRIDDDLAAPQWGSVRYELHDGARTR